MFSLTHVAVVIQENKAFKTELCFLNDFKTKGTGYFSSKLHSEGIAGILIHIPVEGEGLLTSLSSQLKPDNE